MKIPKEISIIGLAALYKIESHRSEFLCYKIDYIVEEQLRTPNRIDMFFYENDVFVISQMMNGGLVLNYTVNLNDIGELLQWLDRIYNNYPSLNQ